MSDFFRCRFPGLDQRDESVAAHFDALNDGLEAQVAALRAKHPGAPLVTFSHFVPRLELVPEKRFLFVPALNKAVGSRFLDARVRALGPDAHIFGHTHFSWDATLGGIRYIQPCLAYSSERRTVGAAIAAGEAFPLRGPEGPLLVCDGGAFPPRYQCCWSAFYDRHARRPDLANVLPAFVARRYRRVEGVGEVGWGDGVQPPTDFAPSWSLDPQWNGGGSTRMRPTGVVDI